MFNESTHGDYRILVFGESKNDRYNKRSEVCNVQHSLIWLNNWSRKWKKNNSKLLLAQTNW